MHNAANALAALALTDSVWVPSGPALDALRQFRGLPHRSEHIADVNGVAFYDDSKGTNVGATVAALTGMPRPVVLIAGGDGKGQNFGPLAEPVRAHARAVVLIGRDAERLAAALADTGVPLIRAADMEQCVLRASEAAKEGDAVLLSPACASYDMFRSYVHRAEVFVQAVKKLAQEKEAKPRG
jgi:UDP-N-acetylmuramoylalanine--D-glutamate ligase